MYKIVILIFALMCLTTSCQQVVKPAADPMAREFTTVLFKWEDRRLVPKCGGGLIGPQHVSLTASCIGPPGPRRDVNDYVIGVRCNNANECKQHLQPIKIIIHAGHWPDLVKGYDIAFIKIPTFDMGIREDGSQVRVARYLTEEEVPYAYQTIVGWSDAQGWAPHLTQTLVKTGDCLSLYDPAEVSENKILFNKGATCYRTVKGGVCRGDNGSPSLVLETKTMKYVIAGFQSEHYLTKGNDCATGTGIITSTAAHKNWLEKARKMADLDDELEVKYFYNVV